MARKLTASDRKSLIRLASALPAGSPERKAILAGLKKSSLSIAEDVYGTRFGNGEAALSATIVVPWGRLSDKIKQYANEKSFDGEVSIEASGEGYSIELPDGLAFSGDRVRTGRSQEDAKKKIQEIVKDLQSGKLPRGFRVV